MLSPWWCVLVVKIAAARFHRVVFQKKYCHAKALRRKVFIVETSIHGVSRYNYFQNWPPLTPPREGNVVKTSCCLLTPLPWRGWGRPLFQKRFYLAKTQSFNKIVKEGVQYHAMKSRGRETAYLFYFLCVFAPLRETLLFLFERTFYNERRHKRRLYIKPWRLGVFT